MKIPCLHCDGEGETECGECGHSHQCDHCNGQGDVWVCITKYKIPTTAKNVTELEDIQRDAIKCKTDHAELIERNPKARESYDRQLEQTLWKLNRDAQEVSE